MEFSYVVYTEGKKLIKGKISASNEQVATQALVKTGHRVISLKPKVSFMPATGSMLTSRVKTEELVLFSRQLALLTESGVGVVQSMELLSEQSDNKQLRQALTKVVADLRSGSAISPAMSKHPAVFSQFYSKMVVVGEQTGDLSSILRSLADYMEREATAMAKLKTALMYPIIVTALGLVVVTILIKVALPPLVGMFTAFKAELPLPTKILLGIVSFSNLYGNYVILGMLAFIAFTFLYTRTPAGKLTKDRVILALPVLGRLTLLTELARVCRSLALLFRSGLPLPEVMELTRKAAGNLIVANALLKVEEEMIKGEGLSKPMSKNKLFLPLMVAMTKVGEEVGNLDETLMTVAHNYDVEADEKTRRMLGLVEPIMMIVMGLGVGFIAIAVFTPMYSILGSVK